MRNIKFILILSVSLFVLFCFTQEASAQTVNYALSSNGGVASFNQINLTGSAGGVVWLGNAVDLNDNNLGSYIGFGDLIPIGGDNYDGEFEGIITFPVSVEQITQIEYEMPGEIDGHTRDWIVETYIDEGAGWNLIDSRKIGFASVPIPGLWNNVVGVKMHVWAEITSNCLKAEGCGFYMHLQELRALGPPVAPTVITNAANNITDTSATLNGNITATGGENPSERGFEWGTVSGAYTDSWTEVGSYGVGAFNRGIAGLASSTTYYFRAKAQNSAGWAYGAEMSFTTDALVGGFCAAHDVWGYAWSENIGWISFSCENNTPIGSGVDYGVDIDGVGNLSGYVWSENIGWISFNAGEFGTCPFGFGPCQPNIDLGTGAVTGYARVCSVFQTGCSGALRPDSERGGWDGWIRLSGTWVNGVVLPPGAGPTSEFEGWAWGGDDASGEEVIGWISFNNITGGGAIDYAVETNLVIAPPNNAPTAAISCNPASCTIYHTEVLVLNNDSTDPDDAGPPLGNITQSEWATSEPPAGYVVRDTCVASPLCNFTPQNYVGVGLAGVGNYVARLIVDDAGGLSDTATRNFSILRDATAGFRCSANEDGPWEGCDTIEVIAGELVWFVDDQFVDNNEYSEPSQGGSPIVSREWRRDGAVFSAGNNQKTSVIALAPSMDITLRITDSALPSARTSTVLHPIGSVVLDLPTWIEVTPF